MAKHVGPEEIEHKLEEILNVLNVIAESLQQSSLLSVEEMGEHQREITFREVLRQEILKKCKEGLVLQMQELLESYGASCVSEVKVEDITSVLTLVAAFNKNDSEGGK